LSSGGTKAVGKRLTRPLKPGAAAEIGIGADADDEGTLRRQHRGGAHSIETRGVIAEPRATDGSITVHASTQKAHDLHQTLVSLMDFDHGLRVVAPDIGGGFGAKLCVYSEDVAVVAAAKLLNRPVKWIEDRREYFTGAIHERDQYWQLAIAVDAEARILGVRGRVLHDTGAYTPQDLNIPYNSAGRSDARRPLRSGGAGPLLARRLGSCCPRAQFSCIKPAVRFLLAAMISPSRAIKLHLVTAEHGTSAAVRVERQLRSRYPDLRIRAHITL
jgi:hypothetical protein